MATIKDKHSTIYGLYLHQIEVYNMIYLINWEMKIYKFEWKGGLRVKV